MKKLVVIFSILLVQVLLSSCGKQNGYDPNAANASNVAVTPTAVSQWGYRNNGYYYSGSRYYVPRYPYASGWGGCSPYQQQPFYNPRTQNITCLNAQALVQFGQPAYIQNYNWGQGQTGVGPGQLCDPGSENSCGGLGICQQVDSQTAYCRQDSQYQEGQGPDGQGPYEGQDSRQRNRRPQNGGALAQNY